jgi:hypothetical protein
MRLLAATQPRTPSGCPSKSGRIAVRQPTGPLPTRRSQVAAKFPTAGAAQSRAIAEVGNRPPAIRWLEQKSTGLRLRSRTEPRVKIEFMPQLSVAGNFASVRKNTDPRQRFVSAAGRADATLRIPPVYDLVGGPKVRRNGPDVSIGAASRLVVFTSLSNADPLPK